jgi:type IV pilus assembly PilN-like protein/type II secretion system (T2SS) protein M
MERLARPLLVALGALIPLAVAWAVPATAQRSALQAEVERLRSYQARQKLGVQLLHGISKSLPELLWLDRLSVSNGQIVVDGRAFNTNAIANFIETLDKLPELNEPLLRATSQEPDTTFKFTLLLRPGRLPAGNTSLKAERDSLLHGLAFQSEMPEALQRLRALLENPGIKVEKFVPLPLAGKSPREQVLPVEIRIEAESYETITALFDRLGRFLPVVALDRLNVARNDAKAGSLTVDLSLSVPVLKKRVGGPREAREKEPASPEKTAGLARQPFQVLTLDEAARLRRLRPEGVAGLVIAELELREIFRTSKGYVAQVWGREVKKLYLLKAGDRIFDGEVVRITPDEVVLGRTQSTAGELREVILSLDEIAKP